MRSVLLFIVIVSAGLSSACKKTKSSPENGRNLPGTWKLKETMLSPGNAVPWSPYEGPARYLRFHADGSLESDQGLGWGNFDRYFVEDDRYIFFITSATSDSVRYGYERFANTLTLHPPCYEACGYRFKKVF